MPMPQLADALAVTGIDIELRHSVERQHAYTLGRLTVQMCSLGMHHPDMHIQQS